MLARRLKLFSKQNFWGKKKGSLKIVWAHLGSFFLCKNYQITFLGLRSAHSGLLGLKRPYRNSLKTYGLIGAQALLRTEIRLFLELKRAQSGYPGVKSAHWDSLKTNWAQTFFRTKFLQLSGALKGSLKPISPFGDEKKSSCTPLHFVKSQN